MNLPTTAIVINWRRGINKSGVYRVHVHITIGRTTKYDPIPLPQNISLEHWIGEDDNWVRNTHPITSKSTLRSGKENKPFRT